MGWVHLRTVPIELYEGVRRGRYDVKGSMIAETEMIEARMSDDWQAGVWEVHYHDPAYRDRTIFGLTYYGQPTHMAYGLDYFDPAKVLDDLAADDHSGRFYFVAGGNGRPIWVERDELARVFTALGLIPRTPGFDPELAKEANQATNTQGDDDA